MAQKYGVFIAPQQYQSSAYCLHSILLVVLLMSAACSDHDGNEGQSNRNFLAGEPSVRNCHLANEIEDSNYMANSPDRHDIRADQQGLFMYYKIRVVNVNDRCRPLPYARVEIWQANTDGIYSSNESGYLRGQKLTDPFGVVQFVSIFPGWHYEQTQTGQNKRAHHVNIRISHEEKLISSTEFYFEDTMVNSIYSLMSPYKTRQQQSNTDKQVSQSQNWIINSQDTNARQALNSPFIMQLEQFRQGYKGELTIGVAL